MKKLILIVLLLAVVGGSYYFYLQKDTLPTNKAHGMVDIRQASLSFELSGRITNLNFDEGDMVKSGDVLAKLDTQALNHQIANHNYRLLLYITKTIKWCANNILIHIFKLYIIFSICIKYFLLFLVYLFD